MSSHDVEFVEQSGGAWLRTPRRVTRNGGAVLVRPHAQISDIAPALMSEGKSKKCRVAPDPEKKWKLIRWYDTSNTERLDPEDRKYDQYQHAHEWIEKIGMKMLPEQIPEAAVQGKVDYTQGLADSIDARSQAPTLLEGT
jgi:hypothetical protein